MRTTISMGLIFVGLLFQRALGASPDHPEARPRTEQSWHRLVTNHREQLSVRRADICLIGDSLTQFWEEQGRIPWQAQFRRWRTVNCGIAADRVEHTLYRVGQLKLVYSLFVDEHERWLKGLTLDGTHFSEAGYSTMAAALGPIVDKLLKPLKE